MTFFQFLKEIPQTQRVASVCFIFACVFAPFMFLYQFNRPVFAKNNLFTLFSLSFGMGFPLAAWNTFMFGAILSKLKWKDYWFTAAIFGATTVAFLFYTPMITLTGRFTDKSLLAATKTIRYIEASFVAGLSVWMYFVTIRGETSRAEPIADDTSNPTHTVVSSDQQQKSEQN